MEQPPPRRPTARPMQAGGCGALKCCRSCLEAKCCRTDRQKTQGRERGGSAADFSQAPKRRRSCLARRETEPPRRPTARPMPAGGSGAPKCCRSCLGRRPAKKPGGEDGAEALPIVFMGPQAPMDSFGPTGGNFKGPPGRSGSAADFFFRSPQASTASFGTTGGKLQGKPDRA